MSDIPPQGDVGFVQSFAAPTFAPTFESFAPSQSFATPTTSVEAGSFAIPPTGVSAYDAAVGQKQAQPALETPAAEVPAAFKEIKNVQADLAAASADRALQSGEKPQINVQPMDVDKPADIFIERNGTVHVAQGLTDKPLRDYNVQVADGADPKITEAVLSALSKDIHSKAPEAVPQINSGKDSQGHDLVSSEFRDRLKEQTKPEGVSDEDKLPENPQMPPGGGGGGGGGGGCDVPKPDNPLQPEIDEDSPHPNERDNVANSGAYRELSSKLGDMNAMQYGNFMMSMLPQELLDQLGPPPWTAEQLKKLQAYMKDHPDAMKKGMAASADGLSKAGDADGAKALNDFSEKMTQDPEGFANRLTSFISEAQSGKASPTDVHRLFAGADGSENGAVEKAIRGSQLLEAAKKYDHSNADGSADLSKLSDEKKLQLIAGLQIAPKANTDQVAAPKKTNALDSFLNGIN